MRTEVTPRQRVLPSWMMTAVAAPPGSPSSSPKGQSSRALGLTELSFLRRLNWTNDQTLTWRLLAAAASTLASAAAKLLNEGTFGTLSSTLWSLPHRFWFQINELQRPAKDEPRPKSPRWLQLRRNRRSAARTRSQRREETCTRMNSEG